MTFNSAIPQPTDNISTSQSQLLSNNAFLGNTSGNLDTGFYKLPNGLILNWGAIPFTTSGNKQQSFAQPYSTRCYSLQFSVGFTSADNAAKWYTGIVSGVITNTPGAVCVDTSAIAAGNSQPLDLSTAKFRVNTSVPGAYGTPVIYWWAIGK